MTGKHSATQPVHATSSAVSDDFANVQVQKVNDPFQGFNRTMFGFNDKLTTYALRPVAHGYALIVPLPARTGISNFFDNLQFPVRFVNSVLQGKLKRSAQETGKFVFNSTFGIGGLFRVSDHVSGLTDIPPEDFGQTLAVWGLPPGPYLVIPVLGPSDCRDIVGFGGRLGYHSPRLASSWGRSLDDHRQRCQLRAERYPLYQRAPQSCRGLRPGKGRSRRSLCRPA